MSDYNDNDDDAQWCNDVIIVINVIYKSLYWIITRINVLYTFITTRLCADDVQLYESKSMLIYTRTHAHARVYYRRLRRQKKKKKTEKRYAQAVVELGFFFPRKGSAARGGQMLHAGQGSRRKRYTRRTVYNNNTALYQIVREIDRSQTIRLRMKPKKKKTQNKTVRARVPRDSRDTLSGVI